MSVAWVNAALNVMPELKFQTALTSVWVADDGPQEEKMPDLSMGSTKDLA